MQRLFSRRSGDRAVALRVCAGSLSILKVVSVSHFFQSFSQFPEM